MIKPVDDIPMTEPQRRRSYREMIRKDIQSAINQKIPKFEFDGDYNWKYLAQYAREEADAIWRNTWYNIMHEARDKYGFRCACTPDYHDKGEYIRITNVKMPDRNHVYCSIDFDAPDRICGAKIAELLKEQQEIQEALDRKDPNIGLRDCGLSVRASTVLLRAGYRTVGDILGLSEEEFRKMRNMGAKSLQEVMDLLAKYKEVTE